jgi:hypothetical protein
MPGKLNETSTYTVAYDPAAYNTTGTLYNGGGTTGSGVDTQSWDEVAIGVLVGTVTTPNTHTIQIMENDLDTADTSNAITGAAFTQINSANSATSRYGYLRCADHKRYLWARNVTVGGVTGTPMSIVFEKSRDRNGPNTTNTFDFEV